ncbi:type II toxin-antitoxin system RelE/ParE family toxin [Steroidobacter flavus]|uniref:Type II toxin-antitoxin system RelE/ParE family toxin n=1 Tax=Steroidobacter flavus TaxID=1842136 RepID=A0ABV8SSV8_9GAMM
MRMSPTVFAAAPRQTLSLTFAKPCEPDGPRLRREAEEDLAVATAWYEQQRAGLGQQFLDRAMAIFNSVAERPLLYPVVHRSTRRALMARFPFAIYFRVEPDDIVVVAVMHGSRHPLCWRSRP